MMSQSTPSKKLLVIGLDGCEASLVPRLAGCGGPAFLEQLAARSARFRLAHGREKFSGLSWEHFSSGRSPADSGRHSAVCFDSGSYEVIQLPTEFVPFVEGSDIEAAIFDCPYFDLSASVGARGMVGWGAHDPGIEQQSKPAELVEEIARRFGSYPAHDCIYGFTWPSETKTREVAAKLVASVRRRSEIARWLLCERLRDWELAVVVVSELHSVIEPMWHGIDTDHPLHRLQSAVASAEGVAAVYREVDALVRKLSEELNGVQVLVFAPHGMGPNESDVPSMLLLAELLLRAETGRTLFRSRYDWSSSCDAPLAESENWDRAVLDRLLHDETGFDSGPANDLSAAASNRPRPGPPQVIDEARRARGISVEWMPASQYRRYWPSMRAFALPAYYNGRIRINLKGRESLGIVERHQYDAVCREITALLMECRDLATGEPLVDSVERTATEPLALNDTEADLEVYWRRHSTDMIHPRLGRIGPAPHRRTGGHTGPCGFAYLSGTDIEPGDRGTGSYLDVVPTIFHLLDREVPSGISGNSLIRRV